MRQGVATWHTCIYILAIQYTHNTIPAASKLWATYYYISASNLLSHDFKTVWHSKLNFHVNVTTYRLTHSPASNQHICCRYGNTIFKKMLTSGDSFLHYTKFSTSWRTIGSFHVKSTQKILTQTNLHKNWFLHNVS